MAITDISAKAKRARDKAEELDRPDPHKHRVIRRRTTQLTNDMVDLTEMAFEVGSRGKAASVTQQQNFRNLARRKAALEHQKRRGGK